MVRGLLFLLMIFWRSCLVYAQEPLLLNGARESYRLGQRVDYLEDPSGSLSFFDITSPGMDSRFVSSRTHVPCFGFTTSAYWVRVTLRNPASHMTDWRLLLEFPNMKQVTFYRPKDGEGGFDVIETGTSHPFSSREIPYHRFVFKVAIQPESVQTLFFRFQNDWAMTFPLTLWPAEGFMGYVQQDFINLGLVYGAYALLIVYNMFLWLALKERHYGYYIGVLTVMLLGHMAYEGIAGQCGFPPNVIHGAILVFFPMSSILGMLFAISFLNTSERAPMGHKVIVGFIGAWSLMLILMPFIDTGELPRLIMPLRLANSLVFTGINYLIWRRGYQPARYFFLAWLMTAMTFIPLALMRLGIMPSFSVSEQGMRFGMILTGLLFSFALADRIQTLQREKDAAQNQFLFASKRMEAMVKRQNIFLEENVRLRTRELETEIHDHRKTEVKLKKAKEAAEAADQAKGRFLSMMSHELRTPLNAILGYAQILKRNTVKGSLDYNSLKTIEHSGHHLLQLIGDLLDMAKIEAQNMTLSYAPFCLSEELAILSDMIRLRAYEKGLAFTLNRSPDLPEAVTGDVKRIRQVLINLLGNAVKFTQKGSIRFEVSKRSEETLRFSIHDTGPGIAEDQISRIFTPFVQCRETGQTSEGAGLGLAISDSLLHMMGSDLHVESTVGKGSTFRFDLTLPKAEAPLPPVPETLNAIVGTRGNTPRILVVDDHKENRLMLRHLLEPTGFLVSEAVHGEEALALAEKEMPDLVLMDLMMPVLDGFETTRSFRASSLFYNLRVIIMTADAAIDPDALMADIGCDAVITKPIDNVSLLQLIGRMLDLSWMYDRPALETPPAPTLSIPPSANLEKLRDLAAISAYTEILDELARLRVQEPESGPFVDFLLGLLNRFQFDAMSDYLGKDLRSGLRRFEND